MKQALAHLQNADPVLAGIIERAGPYRIEYREPEFSTLARAIIFQQLNGKAAASIFRRVVEALGDRRVTPQAMLRAPTRKLRAAGLSARKVEYLRDLAKKTASRVIRFNRLGQMSDEEVIATLTQVKGIGVWSSHMFLIFALRRPNVLAVGDYGVRAAAKKAYGLADLPSASELERIAQPWHPY